MLRKICEQVNIVAQCRKYGIPLWQCPQLLFLIMGLSVIVTILLTYFIGTHYIEDPLIVSLIVIFLSLFLFIISFIITQSFERLAEVAKIKSQFVSIVSHHLRSPISNLRWALEFLTSGKAGTLEDSQKEYIEILKENTRRMNILLKDLLIVSRIESRDLPSDEQKISLAKLTEKIISNFKDLARSFNAEVHYDYENNLPEITADPSQIELVIENLLDNAIRYSKHKEKTRIDISLEKKGRKIYFKIKDKGIGIPERDQKLIFQKFFRSTNATNHQTLGSGLGLYISKAIVEKLKGKIGVESREGEGSLFWFTLPIK